MIHYENDVCMMDFELYYFYCRFYGFTVEDISTLDVGLRAVSTVHHTDLSGFA